MRSSQWESSLVVIEGRRPPSGGGVARIAGLREPARHMVGIRGFVEIRYVATGALSRCACKLIDVALRALQRDVRPGQRELRGGIVIELRTRPSGCRMARRAILRESSRLVVGIRGLVEVRQVAARALRRQRFEVVVHVA